MSSYSQSQRELAKVFPYRAALDDSVTVPDRFLEKLNTNWVTEKRLRSDIRRYIYDWANQSIAYEFGAMLPGKHGHFNPNQFLQFADLWQKVGPFDTLRKYSLHTLFSYGLSMEVFATLMATEMHNADGYFGLIQIMNVLASVDLAYGINYAKYHPNPSEAYSFRYTQFYHPQSGFGPLYPRDEMNHADLMTVLEEDGLQPYSWFSPENNNTYLVFANPHKSELTKADITLGFLTKSA